MENKIKNKIPLAPQGRHFINRMQGEAVAYGDSTMPYTRQVRPHMQA